jgi:CDP-glucose 4,6-dehydratase
MDLNFWRDKKVLVTGHTGFKGSWLCLWLQSLGAQVTGLALAPPTQPNLFSLAHVFTNMTSIIGNIGNFNLIKEILNNHQPEIIFHLAAQPLIRFSYANPLETYNTNVMGTVNLLESIRQTQASIKAVIIVTSDKCYENKEWLWGYREDDTLGGYDPYSNSKACVELVSKAFRHSYFNGQQSDPQLGIATVRAGNVIGGGDWAQDRLIPDIIRSLNNNETIILRYPHALRPWQHVLEPLHGYILLAEKIYQFPHEYSEAWNFGPNESDVRSVSWIVDKLIQMLGATISWKRTDDFCLHEAGYLKLDSTKAKINLGWQPRWNIDQALLATLNWHQAYSAKADMREKTLEQIRNFTINQEVLV